jgi:hypothetical protein
MIRHVVRRGDSLWGLAGQYLGNGARWPEIHKFHDEFALGGKHPHLLPIKDPNLIFVGQEIFIPLRSLKPYTLSAAPAGPKVQVTQPATGLDLKVVYKIEEGQSQYKQVLPHCTLEAKLSGTIAIENMTHGRYRHNLELALSKDAPAVKHKLGQFSDHAFRDLTKGVELGFQDGIVTIKAPIMYRAGLGPYTVVVVAENATKLKGSLKPEIIRATLDVEGRKYKYTADIAFDVTVTLHPTPPKAMPREDFADNPRYWADGKIISALGAFMTTVTLIVISTMSRTRMAPTVPYRLNMKHSFKIYEKHLGSKRVRLTFWIFLLISLFLITISIWYLYYLDMTYSDEEINAGFAPLTSQYDIRIAYEVNDAFLSDIVNPYASSGPDRRSKVTPIRHRVLMRYPRLLSQAFEKYPVEVIKSYLNAIHFADQIDHNGFKFGGSYDQFRRVIYLVDNGWQSDHSAIRTFHHEFSSLLLSRHSIVLNPWFANNPEGFEYLYKSSNNRLEVYKKTSSYGTEADYENGFMNTYGQTSFENDFNEYSAMIFTYPEKFKKIMANHPRVRGKFLVWLKFYQEIDPIFTEEYLFGPRARAG